MEREDSTSQLLEATAHVLREPSPSVIDRRESPRRRTAREAWRSVAATAGDLAHGLLVLFLSGNWPAAVTFFLISYGCIRLGASFHRRGRAVYNVLAISALTFLLLVFRRTPLLIVALQRDPRLSALQFLGSSDLAFMGVSYCYLRVIYALLDPRPWSLRFYLRYYFFFPTFFSGPVMTPEDLLSQGRRGNSAGRTEGLARMLRGTIMIAASSALWAVIPLGSEHAVRWSLGTYSVPVLWAGVLLSGFWLYLNFAGYSDIYIGLARLCGVRAPENFDNPYASTDLTAFWQRWHMSLGSWLRATVYNPLGRWAISLHPRAKLVAGLVAPVVTMAACGAWHMLAPGFVIWGLLHGLGLAVHAAWSRIGAPRLPGGLRAHGAYRAAAWLLTHAFVTVTWVFFLPTQQVPFELRLRLLRALVGMGAS